MPRVVTCVNPAPYKDLKALARQKFARDRMLADKPDWFSVLDVSLAIESPDDPDPLPRDCADMFTEPVRHLPFLRDIIDRAAELAVGEPETWVGYMNDDIIATPMLYPVFEEDDIDIVLGPVWDVFCSRLDWDLIQKRMARIGKHLLRDPAKTRSLDGVWLRRRAWEAHRLAIPDYVIGAVGWDTGVLDRLQGLPRTRMLLDGELAHLKHQGACARFYFKHEPDPPSMYNLRLLEEDARCR